MIKLKNTALAVCFSGAWVQLGYSRDRAKALQTSISLYTRQNKCQDHALIHMKRNVVSCE